MTSDNLASALKGLGVSLVGEPQEPQEPHSVPLKPLESCGKKVNFVLGGQR